MFRYLKWKYTEWKLGEEKMSFVVEFRQHHKASCYNRYEAIASTMRELTRYGILEYGDRIVVDDEGMYMSISFRRKYFKKVLEIAGRVR